MFFTRWMKKVLKMTDKEENGAVKTDGEQIQVPVKATGKAAATSLIDERRKNTKLRKFEVQVFNEDLQDDGSVQLKPERTDRPTILEASSLDELRMMLQQYRMCGQVAKIIREIDPPPAPPAQESSQVQDQSPSTPEASVAPAVQSTAAVARPVAIHPLKSKPKIVTIGDMQVKYDGDTVYQRQWVKLNATEASNFRVVSDASNKIVPMTGKHLEAKRWVRVEETSEDNVDDAVESILAGN